MLVCAVLAMAASPPLTLDPPRTTRPIMANDVFREAMRQLPKMLASHGLEPSGQLLPGTMLPLVRPLKRRAARAGVGAVGGAVGGGARSGASARGVGWRGEHARAPRSRPGWRPRASLLSQTLYPVPISPRLVGSVDQTMENALHAPVGGTPCAPNGTRTAVSSALLPSCTSCLQECSAAAAGPHRRGERIQTIAPSPGFTPTRPCLSGGRNFGLAGACVRRTCVVPLFMYVHVPLARFSLA